MRETRFQLRAVLCALAAVCVSCSTGSERPQRASDDAGAVIDDAADSDQEPEPDPRGEHHVIDRSGLQNVGTEPLDYARPELWLCRPGNDPNRCHDDIDATELLVDGSRRIERHVRSEQPEFDCFYVYPTVFFQTENNITDFEEIRPALDVLYTQAARFTRVCEVFAPLYRQRPIVLGKGLLGDAALAESDVERAFRHYLERYNRGRKFVLLAHSQGSIILTSLIAKMIDGDPELRARMLSALLIGPVPDLLYAPIGRDVGGTFQNVPFCSAAGQTGCIIAFNTFARESPPRETGYGHAPPGNVHPCTDPALLAGNSGRYRGAYLPTRAANQFFLPDLPGTPVTGLNTPQLLVRDMFRGSCREHNGSHYLEIVPERDAGDLRAVPPYRYSLMEVNGGGIHTGDLSFAQDDLIDAVIKQAESLW